MADDDAPPGGKPSPFDGPPIAGVPRPIALGGLIVVGVGLMVYLWKKHQAAAAGTSSTDTTGAADTTGADLGGQLGDWQSSPGAGSGGGGDSGGSAGTGTGTGPGSADGSGGAGGSTAPPTSPSSSTTTNESGQMHGLTLAQAQYLFDTGNQPYVFDPATNQYVRFSGMPVSGQVYYAGPLNWQDALKNGNIIGGTKGHPAYKNAPKPAPAKKQPVKVKPKTPARK